MSWNVEVRVKAAKSLVSFPKTDAARIKAALFQMREDPLFGDIEKMSGSENSWRRRIGSYRVMFEIYFESRLVYVYRIKRRTSSTY